MENWLTVVFCTSNKRTVPQWRTCMWISGLNGGNDISVVVDSQHLTWIATVTGIVFTIVFYIGTKESKTSTLQGVTRQDKSSAILEAKVLHYEKEENYTDLEQAHFSTWWASYFKLCSNYIYKINTRCRYSVIIDLVNKPCTVDPRYHEKPSDWQNMFAMTRFRYMEVLLFYSLYRRPRYTKVRYIEFLNFCDTYWL